MMFVTFAFTLIILAMNVTFAIGHVNLRVSTSESLNKRPSLMMPIHVLLKVAVAVLSVFKYNTNSVILFGLVLVGLIQLYFAIFHNPYHDNRFIFLTILFSSVFLWTALLNLCFQLFIASLGVDGIFCWLISLPFLIFVIYLLTLTRFFKNKLEIFKNEYSEKDLVKHITNFLLALDKFQLSGGRSEAFNRALLQHRSMCKNEHCALLKLKAHHQSLRESSTDVTQICLDAVIELFKDKLAICTDTDLLRVFYISFLMERVQKYKEALIEINMFLAARSNFAYRLIVYRYKKIIEIRISQKSVDLGINSTEIMNLLGGDVYVSKLSNLISVLIKTKISFLSELVTERPSLNTLYTMSCAFIKTSKKLQTYWDKIKKANLVDFRLCQIYSKFLSEILLQHKKAKQLMSSARQEKGMSFKIIETTLDGVRSLPDNANIALVSVNSSKHLYFTKVNAPYAALLGFEQRDLEHQPLVTIFPKAYKAIVDSINEKSLSYLNSKISSLSYFGSEKPVFLRRRTNLIIPAISKVTPIRTVAAKTYGQMFVSLVTTKSSDKNCAHFLVGSNGNVFDFSSEASLYFKDFIRAVQQNRSNMKDFEPNFMTSQKYKTVGVQKEIEFFHNNISTLCKVTHIPLTPKKVTKNKDRDLFNQIEDQSNTCYHVQYEFLNPESIECIDKARKKNKIKIKQKIEVVNPQIWNHIDPSLCIDETEKVPVKTFDINPAWFSSSDEENEEEEQVNEIKIVTKRLKRGNIVELDPAEYNFDQEKKDNNNKSTQMLDDLNSSTSVFKESIYLSYLNNQQGELKNQRKIFSKLIEKEKTSRVYLMLKFKGFFWAFAFLAFIWFTFYIALFDANLARDGITNLTKVSEILERSVYLIDKLYDYDLVRRNIIFRWMKEDTKQEWMKDWANEIMNYLGELTKLTSNPFLVHQNFDLEGLLNDVYKLDYLKTANTKVLPAISASQAKVPQFSLSMDMIADYFKMLNTPRKTSTASALSAGNESSFSDIQANGLMTGLDASISVSEFEDTSPHLINQIPSISANISITEMFEGQSQTNLFSDLGTDQLRATLIDLIKNKKLDEVRSKDWKVHRSIRFEILADHFPVHSFSQRVCLQKCLSDAHRTD